MHENLKVSGLVNVAFSFIKYITVVSCQNGSCSSSLNHDPYAKSYYTLKHFDDIHYKLT